MKQSVNITVAARTRRADGTTEQNSFTARGSWEPLENGWRAEYEEPGAEGVGTRLDFMPDCILWTRRGAVRSRLRFAPGEVCAAVYETPWGGVPMEARTELLLSELDATGGTAELGYELLLGGAADSHRLSIAIETEAET